MGQARTRAEILELFARQVAYWLEKWPAEAGILRERICKALKFTEADYERWIGSVCPASEREKHARRQSSDSHVREKAPVCAGSGEKPRSECENRSADQPEALGPAPVGEEKRGLIANFVREYRNQPSDDAMEGIRGDVVKIKELAELRALDRERMKCRRATIELEEAKAKRLQELNKIWGCEEKAVNVMLHTDAIRRQIDASMHGGLLRLVSGSLFVDDLRYLPQRAQSSQKIDESLSSRFGPPVRMVSDAIKFTSLLHDYGTVKFNKGQDVDKTNYVGTETMFSNLCSAPDVPLWLEIERYPHEPRLPGHYYAWQPGDDDYVPTGETLFELLEFFDNIIDPWHRAIFAAAVATVFWGGPYGKRPFFFFYAVGQNSGKTTAAEKICELVGGFASVNFDQRAEERLKERILSDEFSGTRCLLADNVVGRVESVLLAELATASRISGKKLAVGEAWRPNSLVVFLTGNNPQLVKDLCTRTFFVKFEPIEALKKDVKARVGWNEKIRAFIEANARRVMMDCLAILRAPKPDLDWGNETSERNSEWTVNVLAKVMENEYVHAWLDKGRHVQARDVLIRNQAFRDAVDEELDEAVRFLQALLERVCDWNRFHLNGETGGKDALSMTINWPREPVFIRAAPKEKNRGEEEDDESRQNIATVWRSTIRGDVNPSWVGRQVNKHIESGRLKGLEPFRTAAKRGYRLDAELIVRFLAERAGRDVDSVVVEWREDCSKSGTDTPPPVTG